MLNTNVNEVPELNINFQDILDTRDLNDDDQADKDLKKAWFILEEKFFYFLYCLTSKFLEKKFLSRYFLVQLHYDFKLLMQDYHYASESLKNQPIPLTFMAELCNRMKEKMQNHANKILRIQEACEEYNWIDAEGVAAEVDKNFPENTVVFPIKNLDFLYIEQQRSLIYFNGPSLESIKNACKALGIPQFCSVNSHLNKCCGHNFLGGFAFIRFKITKVKDDINSVFRAISFLLTGNESHHFKIRKILTRKLSKNDKFEHIVRDNTKNKYNKLYGKLIKMKGRNPKQEKYLMNRDYLLSLAVISNMNVVLISEKYGFQSHSPNEGFDSLNKDLPAIYIYFDGKNYAPVISPA